MKAEGRSKMRLAEISVFTLFLVFMSLRVTRGDKGQVPLSPLWVVELNLLAFRSRPLRRSGFEFQRSHRFIKLKIFVH